MRIIVRWTVMSHMLIGLSLAVTRWAFRFKQVVLPMFCTRFCARLGYRSLLS